MKNKLIVSSLLIGTALTIGACGGKKPATSDPAAAGSAATSDATKTDPANPAAPAKPDDQPTKPATGGW